MLCEDGGPVFGTCWKSYLSRHFSGEDSLRVGMALIGRGPASQGTLLGFAVDLFGVQTLPWHKFAFSGHHELSRGLPKQHRLETVGQVGTSW